jgi:hypothetical protein
MTILALITYLGIGLMLMSMLSTARPYRRLEKPGRVLAAPGFSFVQKLGVYRNRLTALALAAGLGLLGRWLTMPVALMTAAFALLIVVMPMRCTLTTHGLALGEAFFVPWNEVRDAFKTNGRLELRRVASLGRLTLALSPAETDRVLAEAHGKIQTP